MFDKVEKGKSSGRLRVSFQLETTRRCAPIHCVVEVIVNKPGVKGSGIICVSV